jgi:hypothetical protein
VTARIQLALVAALAPRPEGGGAELALAGGLARACDVTLFAGGRRAAGEIDGVRVRAADELLPREFDQVLYWVRGSAGDAFIAPLVRALGGTVALDAWALRELAFAAYPALERGGLAGWVRALREGGLADARALGRWRRGERGVELALNRSIVRYGDAFIVPSDDLARRVLDDRNAPTPIGVVARGGAEGERWSEVARAFVAWLERFPPPRAARKPLVALRMAREWRRARNSG